MASSTATLHPRQNTSAATSPVRNPLPTLLHTPTGLALLELQGIINAGDQGVGDALQVGRLDFPEHGGAEGAREGPWMKRVYLYVGANQRLTGEVRRLPRPVAVIRRRAAAAGAAGGEVEEEDDDALEVVEIVRYKLVFSQRPEPVGTAGAVGG